MPEILTSNWWGHFQSIWNDKIMLNQNENNKTKQFKAKLTQTN